MKALDQKIINPGYRADIDGLRAFAVLSVVIYHAGFTAFSGGYVGVDVFFVISGFVITRLLRQEIQSDDFSIINFYERRIRRIFPALIALLIMVLGIGSVVLLPDDFNNLGATTFFTTIFVSNWELQNTQGYFDLDADYNPLLHTWSLAVEEQYYIFFPILLWFLLRYSPKNSVHVLIGIGLISLILCIILNP